MQCFFVYCAQQQIFSSRLGRRFDIKQCFVLIQIFGLFSQNMSHCYAHLLCWQMRGAVMPAPLPQRKGADFPRPPLTNLYGSTCAKIYRSALLEPLLTCTSSCTSSCTSVYLFSAWTGISQLWDVASGKAGWLMQKVPCCA